MIHRAGTSPTPGPAAAGRLPARPAVCLIAVLVALLSLPDRSRAAAESAGEPERLLVGLVIGRRELGSLEVVKKDDGYHVPLEPFAELVRVRVETGEGETRLVTPLGRVELAPEDLEEIAGVTYLRQETIEKKLATPVTFDTEQFALLFDVPWRTDVPDAVPVRREAIEPDATPMRWGLSTLRTNAALTHLDGNQSFASSTVVTGRVADGWWRLRYNEDLDEHRELAEYAWLRTEGNRRYLVGQQRTSLHPLLDSLELTGVQVAQTNRPLELFPHSPEPRELLRRRLQPLTELHGSGPPAGIAELRLDDELVARQIIGLDGIYEFVDIPLPAGRVSRIEVWLYDRHNLAVPVDVHEKTLSASDLLLAAGTVVQLAGAGRAGNLLQDPDASSELAAFYQWRYGLRENVTLEAAIQETGASRRLMVGAVSRLGLRTVLSLAAGASEGGGGYDLTLERYRGPFRLLARSRWLASGFQAADSDEIFLHDVEFGYRRPGLDVALIARASQDPVRREEFVLPALAWRPHARVSFRARPDRLGDYRFDLDYRFTNMARIGLSYFDEQAAVDLVYRFRRRYSLLLNSQLASDRPAQHSAVLRWFTDQRWNPTWSAGLLTNEEDVGFLASADGEVRPGIRARLEVRRSAGDGLQVFAGFTADLAFARGRLVSARRSAVRDDRGAVAGRVRVDGFPELERFNLGGLAIFLNGRQMGNTENDGTFFIGSLKPGVLRVDLDHENLPIELTPQRASFVAEVAAAAVTRVDFVVRPEFGIAGRVTGASGQVLAGLTVELFDAEEQRVKTAVTDQFGLYRIDGLPIGRYTLRLAPASLPEPGVEPPSRPIEIRDDFLFDQDLVVPFL